MPALLSLFASFNPRRDSRDVSHDADPSKIESNRRGESEDVRLNVIRIQISKVVTSESVVIP